jgi:membrane protein required for colicin V production
METLDLILLGVIGGGSVRGWFTGATRQLVSTVGWLVGFILAAALMGPVGSAAVYVIGASERVAPVVGFIVVFVAALAGVAMLGHAARKTLEAVKLGGLDKLAGSALGGLKAALGLSLFLTVTALSPLPGGEPWLISAETRARSLVHDPVRELAPATWLAIRAVVPGVQSVLSDKFNTWDEERRAARVGATAE